MILVIVKVSLLSDTLIRLGSMFQLSYKHHLEIYAWNVRDYRLTRISKVWILPTFSSAVVSQYDLQLAGNS